MERKGAPSVRGGQPSVEVMAATSHSTQKNDKCELWKS
jgi:hypothetical protein